MQNPMTSVANQIGSLIRLRGRKRREGPPYARFGRTIRYHQASFIRHFEASQIMPARKSRRA